MILDSVRQALGLARPEPDEEPDAGRGASPLVVRHEPDDAPSRFDPRVLEAPPDAPLWPVGGRLRVAVGPDAAGAAAFAVAALDDARAQGRAVLAIDPLAGPGGGAYGTLGSPAASTGAGNAAGADDPSLVLSLAAAPAGLLDPFASSSPTVKDDLLTHLLAVLVGADPTRDATVRLRLAAGHVGAFEATSMHGVLTAFLRSSEDSYRAIGAALAESASHPLGRLVFRRSEARLPVPAAGPVVVVGSGLELPPAGLHPATWTPAQRVSVAVIGLLPWHALDCLAGLEPPQPSTLLVAHAEQVTRTALGRAGLRGVVAASRRQDVTATVVVPLVPDFDVVDPTRPVTDLVAFRAETLAAANQVVGRLGLKVGPATQELVYGLDDGEYLWRDPTAGEPTVVVGRLPVTAAGERPAGQAGTGLAYA